VQNKVQLTSSTNECDFFSFPHRISLALVHTKPKIKWRRDCSQDENEGHSIPLVPVLRTCRSALLSLLRIQASRHRSLLCSGFRAIPTSPHSISRSSPSHSTITMPISWHCRSAHLLLSSSSLSSSKFSKRFVNRAPSWAHFAFAFDSPFCLCFESAGSRYRCGAAVEHDKLENSIRGAIVRLSGFWRIRRFLCSVT
jgi:hypothetical protein